MLELVSGIAAILAMVGAWLFGRARYRVGRIEGASEERRRTQEVTKAVAHRLETQDRRIIDEVERAQALEAHELRLTLDLGPTQSQVQDLLAEADELAETKDDQLKPTVDLSQIDLTEGLEE